MTLSEREARGLLVTTSVALLAYLTWLAVALQQGAAAGLDPLAPIALGASVLGLTITAMRWWARAVTDEADREPDERDRDVARRGEAWAFRFLVLAVLVLSLGASRMPGSWAAAALVASALASFVVLAGSMTVLYRRR